MKSDDDYITVATSWHRVTVIGDQAEALAQDEEFGAGALIDVEASYTEDDTPWVDRGAVVSARCARLATHGYSIDRSAVA